MNYIIKEVAKYCRFTFSYLVSGFRGMGKSSFVGKVLNDIVDKDKDKNKAFNVVFIARYFFIFFTGFFLFHSIYVNSCNPIIYYKLTALLGLITFFSFLFTHKISILFLKIIKFLKGKKDEKQFKDDFFSNVKIKEIFKKEANKENIKEKEINKEVAKKMLAFFKQNRTWIRKIFPATNKEKEEKNEQNRVIIKINLGHEILNERDILSLIAKRIHDEYDSYIHDYSAHLIKNHVKKTIIFSLLSFTATWLLCIGIKFFNINFSTVGSNNILLKIFKEIYYFIGINKIGVLFVNFIITAGLLFILYFVFYRILRLIPFFHKESSNAILKDLKNLTDRIDTTVNEEIGPNAGYTPSSTIIGISFLRKRNKNYALANVREIESELIQILEKMSNQLFDKPQFIIVFDELDKIDPEYNYISKQEKEGIPEYERTSDGFPDSMISRKRKQNVLKLLGNMKLFLSSAKAKFIFISGRELYDAYMADLSDREFSISSIFNGAIYVDSFFESTKGQKNIISKTEEYICKQLIPTDYYREKAKERFEKDIHKRIVPDLKLYREFLEKEIFKDKVKENRYYIDKVILFLFQFSVYLSHISNGSPKKTALYFEKYIGHFYKDNRKNPFHIYKGEYLKDDCKYCLSFNVIDQQSIGFVHNIAYPVIQAITNKLGQSGDKLLVSASFLVDHIYKHHKGGFSRDNIEHIPELLEVYRTPELRSFINSIIAFLRQIHIASISSGLYQYKFRKWISYEISYFSKISEEISAIFNFTLDESLSVKRHYYQQIDYFIKLYNNHIESRKNSNGAVNNPYSISLIQLYEILGELHLLDDEFTDAIMKFQSGLQLIKSELSNLKNDSTNEKEQLSIALLMIKNILKLGLTHETQRTYNQAYAVYCELLNYLVDFRYIEEEALGLSYGYDIQTDFYNWKRKKAVFYHTRINKYFPYIEDANYKDEIYKNSKDYLFKREVNPNLMENMDREKNYGTINFKDIDYILSGEDLISNLSNHLTPLKSSIISHLSLFEDVQFMYQIILAKLFVLEKIDLSGITQSNLDVAENEFAYMHLATNSHDKFLLATDFYRKLGAILYLKNGYIRHLTSELASNLKLWGYDIFNDINDFCLNSVKANCSSGLIVMDVLNDFAKNLTFEDSKSFEEIIKLKNEKAEKIAVTIGAIIDKREIDKKKERIAIIGDFMKSDYFKSEHFAIERVVKCNKRRKEDEKNQFPCYACRYFSRSLNILLRYLFKEEPKGGRDFKSRIFTFIGSLNESQRNSNHRGSYLLTTASVLRGMADVQLSCSGKSDEIKKEFLDSFFDMLHEIIDNKWKNHNKNSEDYAKELSEKFEILSRIEKSILYYWTASEYFRRASSTKDTFECLRKILQIFVSYPKTLETQYIKNYLDKIKEFILQKAIMNIYTVYDNINIAEIQDIKWIFGVDHLNKISLNKLSNFPDIEELILLYCELELQLGDLESSKTCYTSIILSPYRTENSIYEKIFSLRFKTLMNKKILNDFVKKTNSHTIKFNSYKLPCQYFEFLSHYLDKKFDLNDSSFQKCLEIGFTDGRDSIQKMEVLNFLISDSIFCLSQVVEVLASSQISQFSNSFIADIYYQLFEWALLYRFNLSVVKCVEDINKIIEEEKKEKTISIINDYLLPLKNIIIWRSQAPYIPNDSKIRIDKKKLIGILKKYFKSSIVNSSIIKGSFSSFEKSVLNNIGSGNRHLLTPNYPAEMAIKYYTRALETHTEGAAYKEMIYNVYLLDDDINNANITFSLGIERYEINIGAISKKMNDLKRNYGNATYYDLEGFIDDKKNRTSAYNPD